MNSLKCMMIAILFIGGCKSRDRYFLKDNNHNIGHTGSTWVNLYKGHKSLEGISVDQYPEGTIEQGKAYDNAHPCMICYYFWDGRVRQIEYYPDGSVQNDFWWDKDWQKVYPPESRIWNRVDFSYGSDPNFQHHKDPRILTSKPH